MTSAPTSTLHAYARLLRFRYHHNYMVVVLGAFAAAPGRVLEGWASFLAHYVTFVLCLYGGIYIINGLIDAPHDRLHDTKKSRPLADGTVSSREAIGLVIATWTLAFGGVYWWTGDTRFWGLYAAFIAVNLVYSLLLRHTEARFLVGVTAPMRMFLGVMIVQSSVQWQVYALAFLFMATVQALKFRIEATGRAARTPVAKGDPLEVLALISVGLLTWELFVGSPAPGYRSFLWIAVASYSLFVGVPWALPSTGPLIIGLDAPKNVKHPRAERWLIALVQVWDVRGLVLFGVLYALSRLNRGLMWLEDRVVPGLAEVSVDGVVFILGHQRSGTTHLHRSLAAHPAIRTSTMRSLWFPSLVLKPLNGALGWILAKATAAYGTPNHQVSVDEPLEEHVWCLHRLRGNALFMLFPSLRRHPDIDALYAEALAFDADDVAFVRSCLRRQLFYESSSVGLGGSHTYVARPLGMTRQHALLRAAFPGARFVVCARDAGAAMTSWVDMFAATAGVSVEDDAFAALMNRVYEDYSRPTFEAVSALCAASDETVLVVPFGDWQASPQRVVGQVVPWVTGVPLTEEEALALVPPRGERHHNATASAQVVAVDATTQLALAALDPR